MNINIQNIELHPGQEDLRVKFLEDASILEASVNSGRRWGKTIFGQHSAVEWLFGDLGCEVGWLAPETNNFIKTFRWFRSKFAGIIVATGTQPNYYIEFKGGSKLMFFGMKNYDAVRGQGFDYAILDEYAHGLFNDPDCIDAYQATLVACKKILKISTPKGKNCHYNDFQRALESDSKIAYEAVSLDNPFIPAEFIEEKRMELPDSRFQQEWEGKFIESGGEVFSGIDRNCVVNNWEEPNPLMNYVFAIDWASKSDRSVLHIINVTTMETAFITSKHSTDYPTIINEFTQELNRWNILGGYAETNGVGQASFDYLVKEFPKVYPFTMSQSSKEEIVTLTRSFLQQGDIKIPSRSLRPELFNQLSDYECRVSDNGRFSYSHPKGGHDDEVDAFMMAMKAARDFKYAGRKMLVRNNNRRRRR